MEESTLIEAQTETTMAWGSDVAVEMLRRLNYPYVALVPGATTRGIHDSIVNYLGNTRPELLLATHEVVAVAMARGYALATGKPIAALLHNIVGLLSGSMAIFDAWCDRVPMLILGGTGPLDSSRRRPWIDWIHTSSDQGGLVRQYVKWDDQPASLAAIPEAILRAHRIAVSQPAGPVYLCFDLGLQETRLPGSFELPDHGRFRPASSPAPDSGGIAELADRLITARMPLVLADRVGNDAEAVTLLVELAELLALPVVNLATRWSFPAPHPLDFAGGLGLLEPPDLVLGIECADLAGALRNVPGSGSATIAAISLDEYSHRGPIADYEALPSVDLPLVGAARLALAALLEQIRLRLTPETAGKIESRRSYLADRKTELVARQAAAVAAQLARPGISEARLSVTLREVVQGADPVITAGRTSAMAPGVWPISGPADHYGGGGGGALGVLPGVALGAAIALRDTGRLPVAVIGDGEFLLGVQALWSAANHGVPALWIVNNNRSYYNDEIHQRNVARVRSRPEENRGIGIRLDQPATDFAAIARSFRLHGEGPVRERSDLQPALELALDAVRAGQLAVVDVWTEPREG